MSPVNFLESTAQCSNSPKEILLLCGGPNDRLGSLFELIVASGLDCTNFDIVNGPLYDLSDTFVFDRLERRVRAGDYAAAIASPECSPFSKLHNLPGPGGPPLTTVTGPERYGRRDLKPKTREKVRSQILVCIRVATILMIFLEMELPFIFETAEFQEKQTSVLHLDEYVRLRAGIGVTLRRGVQCYFGALSSKPTSWLHFKVDLDDMPDTCKHLPVAWYSDMTNTRHVSSHPPTSGKITYSRPPRTAE